MVPTLDLAEQAPAQVHHLTPGQEAAFVPFLQLEAAVLLKRCHSAARCLGWTHSVTGCRAQEDSSAIVWLASAAAVCFSA